MTTRHGFEWTTLRFLSFRVPKRKPSVQKQKDARKSSEIQRLSTDAEEQKRLVAEENLQKKSAEERTKKAASTQSRQLSDLVNYAGKGNNNELKSTGCIKKKYNNQLISEALKFSGFSDGRQFWQMSSFSETKALQLCSDEVRIEN